MLKIISAGDAEKAHVRVYGVLNKYSFLSFRRAWSALFKVSGAKASEPAVVFGVMGADGVSLDANRGVLNLLVFF